ncbi:UNVERIFIED_CONTAM: hypothetical protein Sangu_3217200 [Sesamum angustifolium]|uniref:Uncharacterized protein n=1 Tax=Sesamum angustifolium TaxID=2727405 RepID=A0AAW2JJC4_9LAMI
MLLLLNNPSWPDPLIQNQFRLSPHRNIRSVFAHGNHALVKKPFAGCLLA